MTLLLSFIKKQSWNDFFDPPSPDSPTKQNYTFTDEEAHYTPTETSNAWLFDCYFFEIIFPNGNGAGINLQKSNFRFLAEFCTFDTCHATSTNSYGGSMCILNSDFALNKVCGLNSSASRSSFCHVDGSDRKTNSVNDSTIAKSIAISAYTMAHASGYIEFCSVNVSHNIAPDSSALRSQPNATNEDAIGSLIVYCSFANNTASSQYCIFLTNIYQKDSFECRFSNVIYNHGNRTIYISGNCLMKHCCIMKNKEGNTVFYISLDSLCTLETCSIDYLSNEGIGNLIQTEGKAHFVNELIFITTGECVNIVDKIDMTFPEKILSLILFLSVFQRIFFLAIKDQVF